VPPPLSAGLRVSDLGEHQLRFAVAYVCPANGGDALAVVAQFESGHFGAKLMFF
tara:strand:+ start:606 stop:767 length:162 start_codon:yes stop_codon:yes gene_type:complete